MFVNISVRAGLEIAFKFQLDNTENSRQMQARLRKHALSSAASSFDSERSLHTWDRSEIEISLTSSKSRRPFGVHTGENIAHCSRYDLGKSEQSVNESGYVLQ